MDISKLTLRFKGCGISLKREDELNYNNREEAKEKTK